MGIYGYFSINLIPSIIKFIILFSSKVVKTGISNSFLSRHCKVRSNLCAIGLRHAFSLSMCRVCFATARNERDGYRVVKVGVFQNTPLSLFLALCSFVKNDRVVKVGIFQNTLPSLFLALYSFIQNNRVVKTGIFQNTLPSLFLTLCSFIRKQQGGKNRYFSKCLQPYFSDETFHTRYTKSFKFHKIKQLYCR
jgi:hypothetical protein